MSAIERRILGPRIEAAVAAVREPPELGILLVEEVDDRAHRPAEIVEVQTIKSAHLLIGAVPVVPMKPADECVELLVAPHPEREALECLELARAPFAMADSAVDRRRVGPIRLDR